MEEKDRQAAWGKGMESEKGRVKKNEGERGNLLEMEERRKIGGKGNGERKDREEKRGERERDGNEGTLW